MKRAPKDPTKAEFILQAKNLTEPEARFFVSDYYAAQHMRKAMDMQVRHLGDNSSPTKLGILNLSSFHFSKFEKDAKSFLESFAESRPVGRWAMSIRGIGPVITAGLLAHLAIEIKHKDGTTTIAETAGHFWSFAGLNPERKWEKKTKRPYNAALKQLAYLIGESFKRDGDHPDNFYGHIYRARKKLLVDRNNAGYNAERAKTFRTTSAEVKKKLAEGKLPDGNLDRQACNYAAKIFLSHLHALMYWQHFGRAPAKPFALAILGHAHEIRIPNANMFPGFEEAYYGRMAA